MLANGILFIINYSLSDNIMINNIEVVDIIYCSWWKASLLLELGRKLFVVVTLVYNTCWVVACILAEVA